MRLSKMFFLTRGRLAIIAITVAWIIWGATGIAAKISLEKIPIFSLVFYRLLLASLIVLPLLLVEIKKHKLSFSDLKKLALVGFFGITLNVGLFFLGVERTQAIDASIIFAIVPLLQLFSARVFLKEKITTFEVYGIIIGFLGTLLVFFEPLLDYGEFFGTKMIGNTFIILSALSWVAYTIYSKEIVRHYSPALLTYSSFFVGAISFFPLMVWESYTRRSWIQDVDLSSLNALSFLVFGSSIAAYFFYQWGLKNSLVSRIGILSNIQIISAIFLAIPVLNEKLTLYLILGAISIMFGIILSNLKQIPFLHSS